MVDTGDLIWQMYQIYAHEIDGIHGNVCIAMCLFISGTYMAVMCEVDVIDRWIIVF